MSPLISTNSAIPLFSPRSQLCNPPLPGYIENSAICPCTCHCSPLVFHGVPHSPVCRKFCITPPLDSVVFAAPGWCSVSDFWLTSGPGPPCDEIGSVGCCSLEGGSDTSAHLGQAFVSLISSDFAIAIAKDFDYLPGCWFWTLPVFDLAFASCVWTLFACRLNKISLRLQYIHGLPDYLSLIILKHNIIQYY